MKINVLIAILFLGILTACGAQPTEAPASPTAMPAAPTDAPSPAVTVPPTTAAVPPTSNSSAQTATVSFSADVSPILQSRCFNCHGGRETEEGLDMSTYASLMAGSENGPVIVPGDAGNSFLAEQVVSQEMPKRGPKLTPPQIQIILDWINQGALDN